jgi:hypothetical protein
VVDIVAGESRAVLRDALAGVATRRGADGILELVGHPPPELAAALVRALARVEAELRADDEARGDPPREGGRLHADAFMALLLRVTAGS